MSTLVSDQLRGLGLWLVQQNNWTLIPRRRRISSSKSGIVQRKNACIFAVPKGCCICCDRGSQATCSTVLQKKDLIGWLPSTLSGCDQLQVQMNELDAWFHSWSNPCTGGVHTRQYRNVCADNYVWNSQCHCEGTLRSLSSATDQDFQGAS